MLSCQTSANPVNPADPSAGGKATSDAILLFQGKSALTDTAHWSQESGTAKSATGAINPDVFAPGKSPLRTKGARLLLNLFDGVSLTAVIDSSESLGPDRITAFGRIENIAGSSFIATCENATLSALVTVPGAGTYRVEYGGDGKYTAILQNAFSPTCPPTPVPTIVPDTSYHPAPKTAAGPVVVDIAILYTAAAATGARGSAAMNSLADLAVAQANEAYRNSHIDISLNLVYRGQVNYAESGNIQTDLTRLQSATDAYLPEAHTLRDAYGADIVTLITETGEATVAGLGYVMTSVNPAFAPYAFNVVRRPYARGYGVLAHEVGHNMGCMHDAENSANAGAYAYSFGYRWNGSGGMQYRDIMAYAPGSQINYFSNPSVSYLGVPTGVAGSANAALTLSNTAAVLAAFRTRAAIGISLTSPVAGSILRAPANVILNAAVGGTTAVAKVEFYQGSTLLGIDATVPYGWSWNPVAAGTYTVSAKMYTTDGKTAVSAPVTFSVGPTFAYGDWNDIFVGNAGVPGGATVAPGADPVFTLTGTGPGFSPGGDGFQFLHVTPWTGDCLILAKLDTMNNPDPGALAGVMLRENLQPGGRFMFIGRNPAGELVLQSRTSIGGSTAQTKPVSARPPYAVEIIRHGNNFAGYRSEDGRNWTLVANQLIAMGASAIPGLAVMSNTLNSAETATFSRARWEGSTRQDFPPAVNLSSPITGSSYLAGTALTFTATVADLDGVANLVKVDFFNDTAFAPEPNAPTRLGSDSAAPYSFTWKATVGTAHIKARVEDDVHYDAYSNTVDLNILAPGSTLIYPEASTYVRDGANAAVNFGGQGTLLVRGGATGDNYETDMRFRIDMVKTAFIHATLRVYGSATGGTDAVTLGLYAGDTASWAESGIKGITWNTRPAAGSLIGTGRVAGSAQQWYEFDVSDYVKARKTSGVRMAGFILKAANPSAASASFHSRIWPSATPELVLLGH